MGFTPNMLRQSDAGALVQWLKLPVWKVGDRGFEPHSGLPPSILWGASVTER